VIYLLMGVVVLVPVVACYVLAPTCPECGHKTPCLFEHYEGRRYCLSCFPEAMDEE
jgi:transposase